MKKELIRFVILNGKVYNQKNPTKEGYTFAGWTPVVPTTMPLSETLTATWTANAVPPPAPVSYGGGTSYGGGYFTPTFYTPTVATPTIVTTPVAPITPGQVLGAETFQFTSYLRQGMSSDAVKQLQERLRAEGFFTYTTSTGYFGPITLEAVKAYQTKHGIPSTGFVGPLTIAELNK